MNKAVTDGIDFMPSPFIDGLDVWSREDGTPGSETYSGASNAAYIADDPDFRGCLQLTKTETLQRLRYTGQTPIIPGCYVRVRARLKVLSGTLPGVRIAGWAGRSNGSHLDGVAEYCPTTQITRHDEIVTIEGYVGTGARSGVDMSWGQLATYGHFGIDLLGDNGAVIRIDDIEISDATDVFLRDMLDIVDIRDYGAIGDGFTDDTAALEAADAASAGRIVLVPQGIFRINSTVSIASPIRFHGTLSMPGDAKLLLLKSYDLATYIEAFGDETEAFKKALQALFNHTDHDSLDMCGRRIQISAPIDVAAAAENITSYSSRRVLRNGQLDVQSSASWTPLVFTTQASYNTDRPTELSDVTATASVQVGSLVSGSGVGREVYVKSVDAATGRVTLSAGLYGPAGRQSYTFTRFRYALDFSGFSSLSNFVIEGVEFRCNGEASGIMLAPEGSIFQLRDSQIDKPRDRGITSIGNGCQGMLLDRNQFLTDEWDIDPRDRKTIVFNANANDLKIRNNRSTRFRHFGVLGGANNLIIGNHFFQGGGTSGLRTGGIVLTSTNATSTITGNYVDNSSIEWTNEHDAEPDFDSEYSFGGIAITGNTFLCGNALPSFRFMVIKPYGPGHFLKGIAVIGNTMKAISGNLDRFEAVDASFAEIDASRARNVIIEGNSYFGINQFVSNPVCQDFTVSTPSSTWTLDLGDRLAFGGQARVITSVVPMGPLRNASNQTVFAAPYAEVNQGSDSRSVRLYWPQAVKGNVRITVRIDNPV